VEANARALPNAARAAIPAVILTASVVLNASAEVNARPLKNAARAAALVLVLMPTVNVVLLANVVANARQLKNAARDAELKRPAAALKFEDNFRMMEINSLYELMVFHV